jgi:hypothetical protein
MPRSPYNIPVLCLSITCQPRAEPAADPGRPAPVAGAAPSTVGSPPEIQPGERVGGEPSAGQPYPARASDAPLVRVEDALEVDTLLGRRVRIKGRCSAVGAGRRAGSWTLADQGASIEVRGLVPASCSRDPSETLTIFAQIEPMKTGSRERLLLRLPD